MDARRDGASLAAAVLTLTLVTGCGGSGSDEPLVKPMSEAPSASPSVEADAGGLSPEQQAVADVVVGYYRAVAGRGSSPVGPAIEGLVTKQVYDGVTDAEKRTVDDKGLAYVGSPTVTPEEVTINGDKAVLTGCNDSSRVYLVKKGQKTAGVGSRSLGVSKLTVDLVRDGDTWRVDRPLSEQVASC